MQIPDKYSEPIVFTLIILIVAFIVSAFSKKGLEIMFLHITGRMKQGSLAARTRTISSLLQNIVDVVIFFTAALVILSKWDVNIMPILTGAGILGLAVSFGSQTLIKDLIAGFFIILENQFSVGDRVKISGFEGIVQSISLRLTILEDADGNIVYLPNSQVTNVVRYTGDLSTKSRKS